MTVDDFGDLLATSPAMPDIANPWRDRRPDLDVGACLTTPGTVTPLTDIPTREPMLSTRSGSVRRSAPCCDHAAIEGIGPGQEFGEWVTQVILQLISTSIPVPDAIFVAPSVIGCRFGPMATSRSVTCHVGTTRKIAR
ncbi:MAG: hypothetical protein H7840_12720 [Alphaproteobacteria bacterium]